MKNYFLATIYLITFFSSASFGQCLLTKQTMPSDWLDSFNTFVSSNAEFLHEGNEVGLIESSYHSDSNGGQTYEYGENTVYFKPSLQTKKYCVVQSLGYSKQSKGVWEFIPKSRTNFLLRKEDGKCPLAFNERQLVSVFDLPMQAADALMDKLPKLLKTAAFKFHGNNQRDFFKNYTKYRPTFISINQSKKNILEINYTRDDLTCSGGVIIYLNKLYGNWEIVSIRSILI